MRTCGVGRLRGRKDEKERKGGGKNGTLILGVPSLETCNRRVRIFTVMAG